MDFLNLAEVPEVDSVQDGDTVFVVRDGEVRRVAKDKVGGGAGGYLVDVAAGETLTEEGDSSFIITTPTPGLLEAAASGAVVSIALDASVLLGEAEEIGIKAYIPTIGVMDATILGEDFAGFILAGINVNGQFAAVCFTNGQPIPTTTNLTTLRSKLGGGKSVQL